MTWNIRFTLTVILVCICWMAWFLTGYWAIEKKRKTWAFVGVFLPVAFMIGSIIGTGLLLIWS